MKPSGFFFMLVLFGVFTSAMAQNKNAITPVLRMGSENTISFDDDWLFARFGQQADGYIIPEPAGLEVSSYDDSKWRKLNLPHDWAIEGPFRIDLAGETGKLPYRGIGWYRKHFTVPVTDAGKQIFIDFDGAMAYAEVWLNGNFVGTWPYGYSSFRFDLTPYIKVGEPNTIAVKLNTEKWESRWYPGAGIYRHVWMVKTDPLHVAHWGTYITTPEISDVSALIKLNVIVQNQYTKTMDVVVHTSISELDVDDVIGKQVAVFPDQKLRIESAGSGSILSETRIDNPKRWDIISPARYIAQTKLIVKGKVIETYNTPFGIRTIEFTARNGFLLNGRRVQIQGTCNHHDLGALGAAINKSALRRQLSILQEMGCNSLRTSHNPPAPELLELADKMGFLVWDEAFDTWKTGKRNWDYNKLYDEWHEKDLKALVHRDRNHPSVFIWSIGNEVMDQQNVEMTKHLADIVRKEDPSRPVSNGYNDPDNSRAVGSVQSLDIMGVNYFFNQQPKWDVDPRYVNMPTIGSETSSCVTSRGEYFFGKELQNWQISSYDYAKPDWGCSPDEQFRTLARFPNILGEYVWTGFDYLGEPTPYYSDETVLLNFRNDPAKKAELEAKLEQMRKTSPPSRSSYFGIIDLAGFPKDRFYLYQSHWRPDLAMAHILPHWNWSERIDSVTPVHVYTSGDEAELFLNGRSLGRKTKTPDQDFRLVWDNVSYEPGELRVVSYKHGKVWANESIKTTGKMEKLNLSCNSKTLKADGNDLIFITVKVQDAEGFTVPRSHPLIRFAVDGPGEIIATDNGDATSFVPFSSHERKAFNGLALVIVKAKKGAKGKFAVSALSDGLIGSSIELTITDND